MSGGGAHLGGQEETVKEGGIFHRPSVLYTEEREEVRAGPLGQ
jgi:hypothetical protein